MYPMNKLSITLLNGSQVSVESDDAGLVREVLYSFMPQLLGANGTSAEVPAVKPPDPPTHSNGHSTSNGSAHHVAEPQAVSVAVAEPQVAPVVPSPVAPYPVVTAPVVPPSPYTAPAAEPAPVPTPAPAPAPPVSHEPMTPSEHEYIAFCQRVNPLGDMRRVVVAAEAAHRYLNVTSVDPDSLENLFTLAGWPIPHSFVQTLRNAARTKFRWLERISGLSGHYKVTNTGRSIVLGEGETRTEAE